MLAHLKMTLYAEFVWLHCCFSQHSNASSSTLLHTLQIFAIFVYFALVPSHALGASTSRAATLFYSLIDPFDAEPLTLVFHLPIQIPTWPSTGKTFSAPRNQHLWAGRQKRRWLHSWERDQHRHHFPSPEMSLCGDNRRLFICDHCCPTLLTSEWPIPTDCSMLKESFEKSQRWNSVLLVDLVWFDKGKG